MCLPTLCSDLTETWWMIALALLGATVFAFIWIILMRFLTGSLVAIKGNTSPAFE